MEYQKIYGMRPTPVYTDKKADSYIDFMIDGKVDERSLRLMKNGYKSRAVFHKVIDLTRDNIKKDVRKSYKSLIVKDDGIIFSHKIDNLKKLHFKSAGRKTRPDETWDIQQEMIRKGEAFIVELWSQGVAIAASLFYKNEDCCYYAVAASLDGINTHPVIWSAIKFCKHEGLKRFDLGEVVYTGDEKAVNISKFKCGFGGFLEPRIILEKK